MGLGHIYRVLELADEFGSRPDIYLTFRKLTHLFSEYHRTVLFLWTVKRDCLPRCAKRNMMC